VPFGALRALCEAVECCTEGFADPSIADYDERRAKQLEFWRSQNGQQAGDPAKLAQAILTIAAQEPPPRRFIASADAVSTADHVVADLKAQIDAFRELSSSLGFDAGTRSESSD
jgi:hypothetical protein